MKSFLLLIFLTSSLWVFSQPNPQEGYPARIKQITEKLKIDSSNYALIWERLDMKVNLMGGFPPTEELFSFQTDSNKMKKKQLYYDEFNIDFTKIYEHVIKSKNFDIAEEGEFYLNRVWFYFNMSEFDKAIEHAVYLRDFASYSRFSDRGDYYNNWALTSLFNLYLIKKDYAKALEAVDFKLRKQKEKDPKIYFSTHGSFLNYRNKIQLLEHFDRKNELITFLKQLYLEHFEWYFEKAKHKSASYQSWSFNSNEYYTSKDNYLYFMGNAKEKSFELLKLLISYLKKYDDKELSSMKVYMTRSVIK